MAHSLPHLIDVFLYLRMSDEDKTDTLNAVRFCCV
jgi:hypothetical protein